MPWADRSGAPGEREMRVEFDNGEDVDRARRWLRGRLLRAARDVYPETTATVERDAGPQPVDPGPDDEPGRYACTVVVATGAARPPWAAVDAVRRASGALASDGWRVDEPLHEGDLHRVTADRDGFTAVAAMSGAQGILRLTGQTPEFVLPPVSPPWPEPATAAGESWRPANDVEAALLVALRRGDQENFFGLLREVPLFLPVLDRGAVDRGDPVPFATLARDGRTHLVAFTSAETLSWVSGTPAAEPMTTTYRDLAERWPDPDWDLAIDPDSPLAVHLPVRDLSSAADGRLRLPGFGGAGGPEPLSRRRRPARRPANEVERRLSAALAADDRDAVIEVLTGGPVVVRVVVTGTVEPAPRILPVDGMPSVCVFTSDERLAEAESDLETVVAELADVARAWPDRSYQLAINPGTATAVTLPGFAVWAIAEEASS